MKYDINIRSSRLLSRLDQLGKIGATEYGGVSRIALTQADVMGRNLLIKWMEEDGLQVSIDKIGNIFGTLNIGDPSADPLMIGSHLDSVSNGGKLDGPYGVLAGLEVAKSISDSIKGGTNAFARPIVVANFTNEEGVRFQPDMVGSLVFANGLPLADALTAKDRDGISLGEALEESGFVGTSAVGAIRPHAFLELHIEQGPILEAEDISVGVVEHLQGIQWSEITLKGQANHAGTTPMSMRRDAGLVAAEIAIEVRRLTTIFGGQLGTVGAVSHTPGLLNVVPAQSKLSLDLRNPNQETLLKAQAHIEVYAQSRAKTENVEIEIKPLVRFAPVEFDKNISNIIERTAHDKGYSTKRMISGAGHDAQMLARICPTGMIFVPSIEGISHNPKEATKTEDLIKGLDVLTSTAAEICRH